MASLESKPSASGIVIDEEDPRFPWIAPASVSPLTELVGTLKKHDRHILEKAKSKIRTDLDPEEWTKFRHWANPATVAPPEPCGEIALVHASELTPEAFVERFERPNLPLRINGIVEEWTAPAVWSLDSLYNTYRHRRMKCGEDDDGYSVKLKLKYFLRYMAIQRDDSPMYVFDSSFDDDEKAKSLLANYSVPKYFTDDLFRLVGEDMRPPYRWFLIGPARSGTCTHIDPLATSAWNALISGRKRWVLFPPEADKDLVKGKTLIKKGEDDEAVDYFLNVLPRIKATGLKGIVEFIQEPGETIFIPGGWWHAVLNITDTVAVTQNFCSQVNFPSVWRATRRGRPRMALKLRQKLETEYPHLYKQSIEIDAADDFSLERLVAAKRRRRREKKAAKKAEKKAKREASEKAAGAGAGAGGAVSSSSSSDTSDSDSDTTDSDGGTSDY